MMGRVFFLLFCAVLFADAQKVVNDTLGVGLSQESLNQILDDIILPIIDDVIVDVGNLLPSDCCYKGIEIKPSRLFLENLTIPKESVISTGSVQTGVKGVFVEANVNFNLTFYLHLCVETFGHCDTLFRCKGFSNIQFATTTQALIDVRADAFGEPVITVQNFYFHVSAPHKVGLCNLLDIFIDTLLPLINDGVNIIAPDIINSGLGGFTSNLDQTITLDRPFDFQWAVSNSTSSSPAGAALMLDLDVLISDLDDKPGPFTPNFQVPNAIGALHGDSGVAFEFSDVIINNILYSYFSGWSPAIETEVDGFKVTADLEASPIISFTDLTGLDSASVVLSLKVVLKRGLLRITAHATVTTHFEVVVSTSGALTLQLDPDNFIVHIDSTIPPVTNGTKTLIQNSIESAWASAIPSVNDALEEKAIQLPRIADFNNPTIEYGNGYAALGFDTAKPEDLLKQFIPDSIKKVVEVFTSPMGRQMIDQSTNCPDLSAVGASPIECEIPK